MTLWQALLLVLAGVVGIFLLILAICYGYVAILLIKEKVRKRK